MKEINTGGQAFPHGNPEQGGDIGMTLRDYFAGQVISALFINKKELPNGTNIGTASYEIADAMIKERGKHEE